MVLVILLKTFLIPAHSHAKERNKYLSISLTLILFYAKVSPLDFLLFHTLLLSFHHFHCADIVKNKTKPKSTECFYTAQIL